MRRARRSLTLASRIWLAGACVALLVALEDRVLLAHDANRVQALTVGPSPALAACDGIDANNDNRARATFPRSAQVLVRTRLAGGIGQAPSSDAAGDLIIAHGEPRLSMLDARGRNLWSVRLPSEAASSPVLLANGSILIATRDADVLIFSADGRLRERRTVPINDPRRRLFSIPTASGGALIASGMDVVELDPQARLVRQARARANVTAIAESGFGLLVVTETGDVEQARATGDLQLIANLGGAAPEGGAVQAGKLLAIIDAHKLVSVDLASGQVLTLTADPALAFSGPPTLLGAHGTALVADGGLISLRAVDGAETIRASVAPAAQTFDPAARALRPALLIGDIAGNIAAARSGSDALLLNADGSIARFDATACLDPFRPTPTRAGVAFACRSGQLFLVTDNRP